MIIVPYDLHNHSIISKDGKTPAPILVDMAAERGMKGIGICDHDEFPDEELYDYARYRGIKLALGIEFTCDRAHIIGYNMQINGKDRDFLQERFQSLKKSYVNTASRIISTLNERGLDISYEKVSKAYDKEDLQKLFVMKYLAEHLGMFPSWAGARKYLQQEGVYWKDGADTEELHPVEAIRMIHDAGGFAIWAHPFMTPEDVREEYWQQLPEHNVDAVEAAYAYQENGYKGDESNNQLESIVRSRLKKLDIPVSGGSDSHFPLKVYADGQAIAPGDFGIDEKEYERISHFFRDGK